MAVKNNHINAGEEAEQKELYTGGEKQIGPVIVELRV